MTVLAKYGALTPSRCLGPVEKGGFWGLSVCARCFLKAQGALARVNGSELEAHILGISWPNWVTILPKYQALTPFSCPGAREMVQISPGPTPSNTTCIKTLKGRIFGSDSDPEDSWCFG